MDAHPLLRRLFAALEVRQLLWLLLRMPSDFARPAGDVDLLVAPEDLDGLVEVAEELGFAALPASSELPGGAREVLSRRHLHDSVALPPEDDAFWLLLAHCLLDDGGVPAHHRGALQALARRNSGSFVGRALLSAAGNRHEPAAFQEAVLAGDWQRLKEMGARLVADLKRERSVVESSRATAKRTLRVARKPLLLRRRRGPCPHDPWIELARR